LTTNRSAEELAMRDAVEAWGRARWPQARVLHELVVGNCRIDMAFITPDHIAGVEIKSSMDTLDRLPKQLREFSAHLPELWLAHADRWEAGLANATPGVTFGRLQIRDGAVGDWSSWYRPRLTVTAPTLALLWRNELHAVAVRHGLLSAKARTPAYSIEPLLARRLTGDQIIAEVCHELRSRDRGRFCGSADQALWKADPPIGGRVRAEPPPDLLVGGSA
jgi:hypothetical protein